MENKAYLNCSLVYIKEKRDFSSGIDALFAPIAAA